MKDPQSRLQRRLGYVALGLMLCLFGPQVKVSPPSMQLGPMAAHAQRLSHPFNGQSIVYVAKNQQWQEAFVQQVSGRSSGDRKSVV